MQTDIREFDVQSIKQDGVIAIVGKRGSGKSVLIRDLLHKTAAKLPKQKYDVALAMSPVHDPLHDALETVSNEVTIMPDFNEDALAAFLDKMEESNRHLDRTNVAEACHGLVLMDGCTLNRTCMKTRTMRHLFLNGRHLRVTLVCSFQYLREDFPPVLSSPCLSDLQPVLRSNIDYLFAFREESRDIRMELWRHFFGMFSRFDDFAKVFDVCTEGYHSLVLDNTNQSLGIEDQVAFYKADHDASTTTDPHEEAQAGQGWLEYLASFVW